MMSISQRLMLAICLTSAMGVSAAVPRYLITHNTTDFESNAFVAGTIASQYPTAAHANGKVFWGAAKMACFGHIVNSICPALIRIGTDTPNPLDIGMLYLNLDTGEITPASVQGNGYSALVNGPGEITLLKN
jgi:hypothetical protein